MKGSSHQDTLSINLTAKKVWPTRAEKSREHLNSSSGEYACTRIDGSASSSCWDISLRTKYVKLIVLLKEKSADHQNSIHPLDTIISVWTKAADGQSNTSIPEAGTLVLLKRDIKPAQHAKKYKHNSWAVGWNPQKLRVERARERENYSCEWEIWTDRVEEEGGSGGEWQR